MNSYRKVLSYLNVLDEQRRILVENIKNIGILPCGYKVGNELPSKSSFSPYDTNGTWGSGKDSHAWFYIEVNVPQTDNRSILRVKTDREGWDACNPQFIAYVDGKMRQGLDVNHTEIELDEGKYSNQFEEIHGYYFNQFDGTDKETVVEFQENIFKGIEAREKIEIVEKCHLLHSLINKSEEKLALF